MAVCRRQTADKLVSFFLLRIRRISVCVVCGVFFFLASSLSSVLDLHRPMYGQFKGHTAVTVIFLVDGVASKIRIGPVSTRVASAFAAHVAPVDTAVQ